jgi:protein-tyrosine phosphatase
MTSILFVCLGNICRSPLAEGVFRDAVQQAGQSAAFSLDSAGTGAWHQGNPPDPRSIDIAEKYGIDISGQRARQVQTADFEDFDLILAMDRSNLAALRATAPKTSRAQIRLFLEAPAEDIPDPYYGGEEGFETIYAMLRKGSDKLLDDLLSARPS